MPQVRHSVLVNYSAMQMYQLVNDVLSYPEFIPGCVGSEIISESDVEMVASLTIEKQGIRQHFTTKNDILPGEYIHLTLVNGPFSRLEGEWRFTALTEESSQVEFKLDFEFKNKLFGLLFSAVFSNLMNKMVRIFQQRAEVVYGVKSKS